MHSITRDLWIPGLRIANPLRPHRGGDCGDYAIGIRSLRALALALISCAAINNFIKLSLPGSRRGKEEVVAEPNPALSQPDAAKDVRDREQIRIGYAKLMENNFLRNGSSVSVTAKSFNLSDFRLSPTLQTTQEKISES